MASLLERLRAKNGPNPPAKPGPRPASGAALLRGFKKAPPLPESTLRKPPKAPAEDVVVLPAKAVPLMARLRGGQPVTQARPDLQSETMRVVTLPLVDYFGADLTAKYLRKGAVLPFLDASGSKIDGLRPVQSAILAAVEACNGGLFPVGVGHGKAGAALLAPTALGAEVGIILTTSGTLTQLRKTYAVWRRYFRIIDRIHILSYDQLSTPAGTSMLEEIVSGVPDHKIVVVADEAHKIKRPESARTKRILRFFKGDPDTGNPGHPEARFVALSGTMTSKSLRDFSHLAALALHNLSPLPRDEHGLDAWSECIDVEGKPGDLHWRHMEPLWRAFAADAPPMSDFKYEERRSKIRQAFRSRLRSCPGVVATEEQAIGCSLLITAHKVPIPDTIREAIRVAETDGTDPTGEPLPDDTSVARITRQLSAGFFYVWNWPGNIIDQEWMVARRRWHSLVRKELQANAAEGYDSEFLVSGRIDREHNHGHRGAIHVAWARWKVEREKRWHWPDGTERPHPPTRTIWVDPFYVDAVERFAKALKEPAILWYESRALQAALRERGLDVRAAGEDPPATPKLVGLSTRSHGDGLNLQPWTINVFLEPMSSGERWEQVLGRTHRPGQTADEVEAHVFQHTDSFKRSVKQAREDARYIEDTSGNRQKLNYAVFNGFDKKTP